MSERVTLLCDCGHRPTPSGLGTGYARTADGRTLCYACADASERDAIAAETVAFVGYVSSDGRRFTTWSGGTLGHVMQETESRRGAFGRLSYYVIRTPDGRRWYGRNSGRGMVLRIRPYKR